MLFNKFVAALVLTGAVIPAAFANSGVGFAGGEKAFEFHDTPSIKTRDEVQKELQAYRKNPLMADGGKSLASGAIYMFPQHSYAFNEGKFVHTDSLKHDTPKPSLTMTADERKQASRLLGLM